MAVTSYVKDGKTYWKIYINLRSKVDPTIRVQKLLIGFPSQSKAELEEKQLLVELGKKLERLESQGASWETVIDRWEYDQRTYPTSDYVVTTNYNVAWSNFRSNRYAPSPPST